MVMSESRLIGRLTQYGLLIRLDKPIGSLLLLWPTLWALWIAGQGRPDALNVAVFLAGVFVMRSAGCVINDYADRDLDPHVERTRGRPLAAGLIGPVEALVVFAVLCLCGLALVLLLNRLTVMLAFIGVALTAVYPFVKRYSHLPQFFLGVAFSWGIPMAYAAQTGHVPGLAWVLVLANLCWAVAYDTMYAMADREDDLKVGVKSTAILFGRYDRFSVGVFQAVTLAILAVIARSLNLNAYYYVGWVLALGLALYQQYLIRDRGRSESFKAFLNNAWFGGAIFTGLVLAYLD